MNEKLVYPQEVALGIMRKADFSIGAGYVVSISDALAASNN